MYIFQTLKMSAESQTIDMWLVSPEYDGKLQIISVSSDIEKRTKQITTILKATNLDCYSLIPTGANEIKIFFNNDKMFGQELKHNKTMKKLIPELPSRFHLWYYIPVIIGLGDWSDDSNALTNMNINIKEFKRIAKEYFNQTTEEIKLSPIDCIVCETSMKPEQSDKYWNYCVCSSECWNKLYH
jgi:hypothetical protein